MSCSRYIKNNVQLFCGCKNILSNRVASLSTTVAVPQSKPIKKMNGWQIHSYGDLNELQFSNSVRIPNIQTPTEVLIQVKSSSINPIDLAMIRGYGSSFLNLLRCNEIEFPLTLGRDFCGTVIQKGLGVSQRYNIGDKVIGVSPIHKQGSHAEYVLVDSSYITHTPSNINDLEAGSILYAALTAWSGLFVTGLLKGLPAVMKCSKNNIGSSPGKNILILGGSGGVGNAAIQIAKAENCNVTATCATGAVELVKKVGADNVIDYITDDFKSNLVKNGPYDIILDCAGKGPNYAKEIPGKFKEYITFSSPFLRNTDQLGLNGGLVKNVFDIVENNVKSLAAQKGLVKWGYFVPLPNGIEYIRTLISMNKMIPILEKEYSLKNLNEGYDRVAAGHLRGKIVVSVP